jgi:hypothetical protein
VGTAVGTLFRFWSYRRFVFGDTVVPDPTPVPPVEVPARESAATPPSAPPPAPRAVPRM